jgi:hypothetical protein
MILAAALTVACADEAPPPVASTLELDAEGRVTPLRCPGAPACETASGALRVGVAVRSITPRIELWTESSGNTQRDPSEPFEDGDGDGVWDPVWLAGFGVGRAAREVHDDMWARALSFSQGELRVGVVSLDTIGYFHDGVLRVRLAARARGLDLDHIIVASTHQHEGQDTLGLWGQVPLVRSIDEAYLARIEEACVEALIEAQAGEREARVTIVQGEAPELVDDSRLPEVVDATFTTLRFEDTSARTFATWTLWGNHPEALDGDSQAVTSDYPHYLRLRLESEYPGSTAVFSAGSLGGLMNPLHIVGCPDAQGQPTCRPGTFELAEYIGRGLGDKVVAALRGAAPQAEVSLTLDRRSFLMGSGNGGFAAALTLGAIDRQLFHADGRPFTRGEAQSVMLVDLLEGRALIQSEVNVLGVGPLEILFVPGELYPELWLEAAPGVSRAERPAGGDYPDAPLDPPLSSYLVRGTLRAIVNQANDSLGYIIPKSQFDQVAPFAYGRSSDQYGEQNSNGPDTAPAIHEAVQAMMGARAQ